MRTILLLGGVPAASATITFSLGGFGFSASASAALPTVSSTLGLSLGPLSVGAALTTSIPGTSSTLALTLGPITFSLMVSSGVSTDLLQAIKTWFEASPIRSSFPGDLWVDEIGRDAVTYPLIVISSANEMEPGESIELHENQIQVDIYARTASSVRSLAIVFHNAFMPNSGRSRFLIIGGGEATTLYETGTFRKPRVGSLATQNWRWSRTYTIYIDNLITSP